MIQLNYNIANAIAEYDLISHSKQNPSRANLIALRPHVNPHYTEYLNAFNNIHGKAANVFNVNDSTELRNCYNNPTGALDNLKVRLINCQTDTFKFLCPYCLIINHTTFDHYIPQEEQPVFSVCAKNLIPCCGLCNGKKLQYWKEGGQRAIIHFYNDIIPNEKFLFCDLSFNGSIPILNFRLSFSSTFDPAIRFRIEQHFTRLDLINRYDKTAPKVLSDIDTDFNSLIEFTPTVDEVSHFLSNKANELFGKCGDNYWYALAYETLSASNIYMVNLTA